MLGDERKAYNIDMIKIEDAFQRLQMLTSSKAVSYGKPADPFYCLHTVLRLGVKPWKAVLCRVEEKLGRLELAGQGEEVAIHMNRAKMVEELYEIAHLCLIAAIELEEEVST